MAEAMQSNDPLRVEFLTIEVVRDDLLAFFADRLKVHLREEGVRHDLIDAVFALPGQDDLALIVKRVEALSDFLETDDGENLLAGAKRAANILAIEEKKDATTYDGTAMRFYIDATLSGSTPKVGGTLPNGGEDIWIGGNATWGEHLNGIIDEVRMYNRALSQAEIQALMTGGSPPTPTPTNTPLPPTATPTAVPPTATEGL